MHLRDINEFSAFIKPEFSAFNKTEATRIAIVKFGLPSCPPCKIVGEKLLKLRQKYPHNITLGEINLAEGDNAEVFNIHKAPVVHVYYGGKLIVTTNANIEALENEIAKLL